MKNRLENTAKDLRRLYHLQHVYFSQKLGKRSHFLAGSGETAFGTVHQLEIADDISIHWEGDADQEKIALVVEPLKNFIREAFRRHGFFDVEIESERK